MNKDLSTTKEIDDYLFGELTPELKTEFEKRVRLEHDLQEEVEITKRLIKAIHGYGFKQMLKKIHIEQFGEDNSLKSE